MNIANNEVLRSDIVTVDPQTNDYVRILGDEQFTQNGNTYVRLAGQESPILHAPFSSARIYTIYYRDINDVLNANTVITRTEIIDTPLIPGAPAAPTLTAVPTPVVGTDGAPAVDAGVAAGDGAVVINDDDNPLANLEGVDTSAERVIDDEENPLASGIDNEDNAVLSTITLIGTGLGLLVLLGAILYFIQKRRRVESQPADGQNI